MDICSVCLNRLEKSPGNCNDPMIHFNDTNCRPREIYTTTCNHKFHHCCWYSYVYITTGIDTDGERGIVDCPLCRTAINVCIK